MTLLELETKLDLIKARIDYLFIIEPKLTILQFKEFIEEQRDDLEKFRKEYNKFAGLDKLKVEFPSPRKAESLSSRKVKSDRKAPSSRKAKA